MKSLRLRLVLSLLLGLGAVWGVSAWVGHKEARNEVDELFDAQLAQSAQAILESSRHTIHERREDGDDEPGSMDTPGLHQYEQKLIFQVWSADGTLLQRSPDAPEKMIGKPSPGYQTVVGEQVSWRVLTRLDQHGEYMVQVAEPLAKRELLARHIAFKILLPTLLVLPLLALLIWWFVGAGLRPLRDISQQVQARAVNRLDALKINEVPDEVAPLAQALNELFGRLQSAFESERRFTADAAHELRTPLAGLKIQAQVAMRAVDEEERKAALEKVLQGVDRATHLIAQLL
ncbi:MAG: sensor histidine kinase N-terminal domain-containing protein, partial [Methylophilales bacterium]|nr:sensor histidine kinase N-terminal domain-containing protein [Methylophilales bacterium]